MRALRLVLLPLLVMGVAACDSDPTEIDARDVTFAPELGIDLDAMTRIPGGIYYQDLETGRAPSAMAGREVWALYRGWLSDGTLFDERQDPTSPFHFRLGVGQVIEGWDRGLAGLGVGGVRKLVIPPSMGYGDRSHGPIPANSVLVFEVELLDVR